MIPVEFVMEMHDYQEEYLSKKAVHHNLDSGGAFRALLSHAATEPLRSERPRRS